MNKGKRVVFCIIFSLLAMFLFAGCSAGSTVNTELLLHDDLSGIRTMNVTINHDIFSQYFDGSIEDLKTLITSQCPAELRNEYSDAGGNYSFNFYLEFDSLADYQSKVESILGEPQEITISTPDTIWAKGIYISESFDSMSLLSWLKTVMIEKGYVTSDHSSQIFTSGSTIVTYQDIYEETNDTIYLDAIDSIEIESIDVLTDANTFDDYSRTISFQIATDDLSNRTQDIEDYFKKIKDSDTDYEKTTDDSYTYFKLSKKNMSLDSLAYWNATIFGEESTIALTDTEDENTPFYCIKYLEEEITLTNYIAGNYNLSCNYYMNFPKDYEGIVSNYFNVGVESNLSKDSIHPDYYLVKSTQSDHYDISLAIRRKFPVEKIQIDLSYKEGKDTWTQTSTFILSDIPTDEEMTTIIDNIKGRYEEPEVDEAFPDETEALATELSESNISEQTTTITEDETSVSSGQVDVTTKTDEEMFQVVITQQGNSEELKESSLQIFNKASKMGYGTEYKPLKVKKREIYWANEDLTTFSGTLSPTFSLEFTIDVGFMPSMQYSNCSSDELQLQHGTIAYVNDEPTVDIEYVGTRVDVFAIAFWILILAGIALIAFAIYRSGIIHLRAALTQLGERLKAGREHFLPEAAATKEASQTPDQKHRFCEKCGTPRIDGARFCEKCGAEFPVQAVTKTKES